tara:strand:+ start:129 stop:452 length:324 start_codon:yes stop_codon:yes gene_type:complete
VVEEVEITPVLNHLEILVDLVVEQTMLALVLHSRDWQHKGPKIHHLVEHLDLISMETTEDLVLEVQSIIVVAVVVPVVLAVTARQALDQMQQVMEALGNHSLILLDL